MKERERREGKERQREQEDVVPCSRTRPPKGVPTVWPLARPRHLVVPGRRWPLAGRVATVHPKREGEDKGEGGGINGGDFGGGLMEKTVNVKKWEEKKVIWIVMEEWEVLDLVEMV